MIDIDRSVRREAISIVCCAESMEEAICLYRAHRSVLRGCRFLFGLNAGGVPGYAVSRTFKQGAAVRGLFASERVAVLDEETISQMEQSGGTTFSADFSIALDTNAVSHLAPYMEGKKGIDEDIAEVFEFISRPEVRVDPLPYILENLENLEAKRGPVEILRRLQGYLEFRSLDLDDLRVRHQFRSKCSRSELELGAKRLFEEMLAHRANPAAARSAWQLRDAMLALLLGTVLIAFDDAHCSPEERLLAYFEFCHDKMAAIFQREASLALAYFERGHSRLGFFRKVQKGMVLSVLIHELRGMAWDLAHVRQLESRFGSAWTVARFFFPAFLTFDRKLVEAIDLQSVRALGYSDGDSEPVIVYQKQILDAARCEAPSWARLFSHESKIDRAARRPRALAQLPVLIESLTNELRPYCKPEPPGGTVSA